MIDTYKRVVNEAKARATLVARAYEVYGYVMKITSNA